VDCAEVPYGKMLNDSCGQCLLESDSNFGQSCGPQIVDVNPRFLQVDKGAEIEVRDTLYIYLIPYIKYTIYLIPYIP